MEGKTSLHHLQSAISQLFRLYWAAFVAFECSIFHVTGQNHVELSKMMSDDTGAAKGLMKTPIDDEVARWDTAGYLLGEQPLEQ
jgi:hypothetical protein